MPTSSSIAPPETVDRRAARPLLSPWTREFLGAATRPSLPALLGALAVTGALFAACFALITPGLLWSETGRYLAAGPRDDYSRISSEALRHAVNPPSPLQVAIVGASAHREAISSREDLASILADQLGQPVDVLLLTASNLEYWEAASLVDLVSEGFRGVVVLGVSPRRVSSDPEILRELSRNPRLAFRSGAFDEELELASIEAPRRTGIYFLDNQVFFAKRLDIIVRNLLHGPPAVLDHHYDLRSRLSRPDREALTGKVRSLVSEHYAERVEGHLSVISRMIERTRRRSDALFVLLEMPRNPEMPELFDSRIREAYRHRIRRFAAERPEVEYWDLNDDAGCTGDDFYDWCHLRSDAARRRYTRALAEELTMLLKYRAAEEGER